MTLVFRNPLILKMTRFYDLVQVGLSLKIGVSNITFGLQCKNAFIVAYRVLQTYGS